MESTKKPLTEAENPSTAREFFLEQLPVILTVFGLGVITAYLQHGFMPGGGVPFPLAGVKVPLWHLVWMGAWTGYTMAVVGEAAGILALPYSMSILQFVTPQVTPTIQLMTFLNPLGALMGFYRNRQWNLDLALWVCLGGVVGGLIGPFVRLYLLSGLKPFIFVVGLALVFAGFHLCYAAFQGLFRESSRDGIEAKFAVEAAVRRAAGQSPAGIPPNISIETISRGGGQLTVRYWQETWTVNVAILFVIGGLVGIVSAALGVGGGFLLVPIFSAFFGLPMYVLVAATIPYVIVLSAVGLFTYTVVLGAVVSTTLEPEWAWGFFAAAGGIFGAWAAAKTQRFVPEHLLKLMLGGITGGAGVLYVVDYFFPLPFRI